MPRHPTLTGGPVHHAATMHAREHLAGRIDRREFLTRATALGMTTAGAYAMIGAPRPARAAGRIRRGGELRIQQEVRALKDPRTFDLPQMANFTRGYLEYLVEYRRDGSIRPFLLESYAIDAEATVYTLVVRAGVRWQNGDPFTAGDVAHNIRRWCDATVPGNSMATRMGSLVDPGTRQMIDGGMEVDGRTVTLRLPEPDISLIAGMSDYPAAIVHPSYGGGDPLDAIGTGPYRPDGYEVGAMGRLVRAEDHEWWGAAAPGIGGAHLDSVTFLDFGADPADWVSAAGAGEVDMLSETVGDFIEVMDSIGWTRSEAVTASTICIRPNQRAEVDGRRPYADVRVRRALQLATDNDVLLELGYAGRGARAENDHVCPIHPEWADIGPAEHDPGRAIALLEEAGMADYEHELHSIDEGWRRYTTDAVAAQLRDAGIPVRRTVLPGTEFWNGWARFPFSSTDWNHRPLGVQVLELAYRSGVAWNETGFANEEFDALLRQAKSVADAESRSRVMGRLQGIMRDEGVIVQPFWRSLYRHQRGDVANAEMHPASEIHLYRLGFEG
ncbi:peptide/nickel transport system substrate-binding protein [Hasllibacter halocynthiae]|uniref:Peptide/nickel transport system substrate-binding protein n=1 Tax=Hasllibacter halocynthiae TaxID=595589 RepID=A0A2T0X888_9RHOB|nr:ABC transporter substrate-binding protein [Hasllibacter halocynthiae]PRY95084.1 peptide/nickel transport system substrate-binding protein [Hasllibacter halocynthiae]